MFILQLSLTIILFSTHFVLGSHDHAQEILYSASEPSYPPFAIVRPNGIADGFSVELLKAVIEAVDYRIQISVGSWHEIKQQLIEGRIDVLPLVAYSHERDKVLDFTVPYMRMHGAIFVRKEEKSIHNEADLKGKEVLVMRDDASHDYALSNNISERLILTDSFEEAMQLLSIGKYDAVLCQYLVGLQLINKLGIKNIVSIATKEHKMGVRNRSGLIHEFCIAVPEGRKDLLADLNEGLALVIANGTYEQLYQKWFGPILPRLKVPLFSIIRSVLFILIPLLLFLQCWAYGILKKKCEVKRKVYRERSWNENRQRKPCKITRFCC